MNFDETLYSRRSARLFTDKKVSSEQLQAIISSGSVAPSARNRDNLGNFIF